MTKKTGKITKIRGLDGRFSTNARLDGRTRLQTGDLANPLGHFHQFWALDVVLL